MSQISSLGAAAPTTPSTSASHGPRDLRDLDVDQFLRLLISELQNQDPLNPMDNSEMVQQISQIRQISATSQLSDTLATVVRGQNLATASSLIGKNIAALTDDQKNIEGRVERVTVASDPNDPNKQSIKLHVGDSIISLKNVREIIG